MKILKSVGFFLGLFVLLMLGGLLFCKTDGDMIYDKTSVRRKVEDISKEKPESIQVLFVGDSICYSSFSPEQLWKDYGITSYVCGTSAQRLCDSYAILKQTFEVQSPKVIVMEATCFYRNMNVAVDEKDFVLKYLTKYVPIIANHSDWKDKVDKIKLFKEKNESAATKGFIKRESINPYRGGEYMHFDMARESFPDASNEYLLKIKKLCDENGATLVVVSSPSPYNWSYARHNAVADWTASNGVDYIDMNLAAEIGIDWEKDTKDGGDHLNMTGAAKVCSYFGRVLIENYAVEDLRENEKYKDWMSVAYSD